MKKMKRLLGVLLVCVLMVGLVPQQAEASEFAQFQLVRHHHSWYDNNGQLKFLQYFDGLYLPGDTAAERKINASVDGIVAKLEEGADENIQHAMMYPPSDGDYYRNYYDATVTKNSDGVLSIKWVGNWYLGGVSRHV